MSFLNPILLLGLLAVAIPVILHFINLKKPRLLAFSTIAFFTELQKSTLRRLNIKRLLLLAVRSLAVIFLALALARPFLPPELAGTGGSGGGHVVFGLLIDNSPGMGQIDENGPYIEQAREIARNIINSAESQDQFIILTTHGEPGHNRPVNRQEAQRLLGEINVQNKGSYIQERLQTLFERMKDNVQSSGLIYWISHGQKTHVNAIDRLDSGENNMITPVMFLRIGDQPSVNTAITAVRLSNQIVSKGIPFRIEAEVKNFGNEPAYNQFLRVETEGNPAGEYQVDLDAGETKSFVFEIPAAESGDLKGVVRLEGDAYTFDNTRYFSVNIPETRHILLVQDQRQGSDYTSYLRPVLEAGQQTGMQIQFNTLIADEVRGEDLHDYDAIILDALRSIPDFLHTELQRFVQRGGGLIVFPSERADPQAYNRFLELFNAGTFTGMRGDYGHFEQVAGFQTLVEGHPVLDEIFEKKEDEDIRITMPDLFHYWIYESGARSRGNVIFRSNLNEPLLSEHRYGDGILMVSSLGSDPGWSNFPTNALFAPVYYRLALYAVSFEETGIAEHILGRAFEKDYSFGSTDMEIRLNEVTYRPETAMSGAGVQIRYDGMEWEPGWAEISDGQNVRSLAVNQDISESDFSTFNEKELGEILGQHINLLDVVITNDLSADEMTLRIESAGIGSEIWNWFIWLALVLLIAECIITKRYKAERLS